MRGTSKLRYSKAPDLQNKTQTALLSKGYFPKELPYAFTTADFGAHSESIIQEWEKSGIFKINTKLRDANKKNLRGAYIYIFNDTEAEILSTPKRGFERRLMHITHPLPQALLAREIASNWLHIKSWIDRHKFTVDEFVISDSYSISIKDINFQLHREKVDYIASTADWLVRTDITRFYPSIYTHSIPWAAYGKERVKQGLRYYKGSLADRLDSLTRACNRNQTVGIPIGPETSRILSEITSARIDCDFSALSPHLKQLDADRLQDDWTIGAKSLQDSEELLSRISSCYRHYGLEINGSKTSIRHIVNDYAQEWKTELASFLSHRSGPLNGSRLREFLDLSVRLQSQTPSDSVISYSLSVLERSTFSSSDAKYLESFLLRAAAIAPISLPRVCTFLLSLHTNHKLSSERVSGRLVSLTEHNIEKENHFEVIWLLYTLRGMSTKIKSAQISSKSEYLHSSSIALILLYIKSRGNLFGPLPTTYWENSINEESIYRDWSWLLAYEGIRNGWLHDKHSLMKSNFFRPFVKHKVVFYDKSRNVPLLAKQAAHRMTLRKKNASEVIRFFAGLRGFASTEY
jgi:hypothetical protein